MTDDKPKNIDIDKVMSTTNRASETVEFAGFLTKEDDNTFYISDAQGTWMIPRKEVIMIEDWEVPASLKSLSDTGKPVRVVFRDGCTIHEIRPWHVEKSNGDIQKIQFEENLQKIFTGGSSSSTTMLGREQLMELEKTFMRKLGWNPRDHSTPFVLRAGSSKVIDIYYFDNEQFTFTSSDADF